MKENKPVRIQRSRQHKNISPNGLPIVYVGRPTIWGNPFQVNCNSTPEFRNKQLEKYRNLVIGIVTPDMNNRATDWLKRFRKKTNQHPFEALSTLKSKNLSCFCKIGDPCHADILLELANQ